MSAEDDDFNQWMQDATDEEQRDLLRREIARVRRIQSDLTKANKRLMRRLDETERARDLALGTADHTPPAPLDLPIHSGKLPELVTCCVASDWHINETVRKVDNPEIENEYNPEIAQKRSEMFFQGFAWYTDVLAASHRLTGMVLFIIGDIIDNELHIDGARTNSMSPMEGINFATDLISPGISFLRKSFPKIPIRVHWQRGNHERTDRRTPMARAMENSLSYVIASNIHRVFRDDPMVSMHIPRSATSYERIFDFWFRVHHGDGFRYAGGVGGILIPYRKWIYRADEMRQCHASLVGHWHQYMDAGNMLVNGSLKGYDPLSNFRQLPGEPPRQAAFAVDRRRGKVFGRPIYVGQHGLPY